MKHRVSVAIALALVLSGCAHQALSPNSMDVDSIIRSATNLEGKQVTVAGYLRFGDDSRNLWSSGDSYIAVKNGQPLPGGALWNHCIALNDINGWRRALLSNNERNVLITGVIHRIPFKDDEISLGACSDLGISIRSV